MVAPCGSGFPGAACTIRCPPTIVAPFGIVATCILFLVAQYGTVLHFCAALRIRIRGFFDPWIRDQGWGRKSGSGSKMNIPDRFRELLIL
jgi:hypothetical protein